MQRQFSNVVKLFIMIRLLLVDDRELVDRELLEMLERSDIKVVGMANNKKAAIEQVKTLQPNVVLINILMPITDATEAIRTICQQFSDLKVLIVSNFDEDDYITQVIKAGARGCLLKDTSAKDLARAIAIVDRGYSHMGPGLMEKMLEQLNKNTSKQIISPEFAKLSPRQIEVLNLIGTGCSDLEIAQQLYITEETVKNHIIHILKRANLKNREQIVIYANSYRFNK